MAHTGNGVRRKPVLKTALWLYAMCHSGCRRW